MNILSISRLNKKRMLSWHGYQTRKDKRHINSYSHYGKRKRRLKRYYNRYIRKYEWYFNWWDYKKIYDYKWELF